MRPQAFFASFRSRVDCFRYSADGSVAPIFALALVPLMALAGAAVDYSHANSIRTAMQAAADSTALNLAKNAASLNSSQLNKQATDSFNSQFTRADAEQIQVSANYNVDTKSLSIAATGSMKASFIGVMGFSNLALGARAVAVPVGEGNVCVLALSRTASGSVTAQGSTNIKLSDCSLYDNSSSSTALMVGGSAKLSALSVSVAGGISGGSAVTATKEVTTGVAPLADPYASLAVPFYSGCVSQNFTAKDKVTINPGVYCGGMKLNAGADVTLNPGIYYIDQGDFVVNGGATLTGTGVTIIFTSSTLKNWPTASVNGGAVINLTPPTDGPTKGVVMFADRNSPVGTLFSFSGGASQYFGGALYFPTGALTFGGGGVGISSSCTKLIADTISFTGESKLAIDCKGYATKAFGPTGVRLAS